MKICSSCKVAKEPIEFIKNRQRNDGLHSYCKKCSSTKAKEYRKNNPTKWEIQREKNFIKWRESLGVDPFIKLRNKAGEGYVTREGYLTYHFPNHPCADKNGRVQASHLVFYEKTGYLVKKTENIHHKNGERLDNRIENLELCTTNHPRGQRVEDKINWCIDFLEEYGYIVKKE